MMIAHESKPAPDLHSAAATRTTIFNHSDNYIHMPNGYEFPDSEIPYVLVHMRKSLFVQFYSINFENHIP